MAGEKVNGPGEQPSVTTTEEMLLAALGRLVRLEASIDALIPLLLRRLVMIEYAFSRRLETGETLKKEDVESSIGTELTCNNADFDRFLRSWASARSDIIHNQLESLAVQFPQFRRFLIEHLAVSESDLAEGERSGQ